MTMENNASFAPRIKPAPGRILVELIPEPEKTKKGIILSTEINQDKPREGWVRAVGDGVDDLLQVGKRVLFSRAAFNGLEIEDKDYYFLIEEDVLGVFEE